MINDETGIKLHEKSCTSKTLTQKEKEMLEQWYAAKDAQQAAHFAANASGLNELSITELIKKAEESRKRVEILMKEIKILEIINERKRKKNEELRKEVMPLIEHLLNEK